MTEGANPATKWRIELDFNGVDVTDIVDKLTDLAWRIDAGEIQASDTFRMSVSPSCSGIYRLSQITREVDAEAAENGSEGEQP